MVPLSLVLVIALDPHLESPQSIFGSLPTTPVSRVGPTKEKPWFFMWWESTCFLLSLCSSLTDGVFIADSSPLTHLYPNWVHFLFVLNDVSATLIGLWDAPSPGWSQGSWPDAVCCLLPQIFALLGALRCSVLQCAVPVLCMVAFWLSSANGWQRHKDTETQEHQDHSPHSTAFPLHDSLSLASVISTGEKMSFHMQRGKVPYLLWFHLVIQLVPLKTFFSSLLQIIYLQWLVAFTSISFTEF